MTQEQLVINHLQHNRFVTIRSIEEDLKINGAYAVINKVKKIVNLCEDWHINFTTNKRFKFWWIKKGD